MPFARIEAYKIRVDKKGTLKTIDQAAKQLFLESLAIFLKEVMKHVPVWTGMSRGSLRPLARYLTDRGYKVTIPISPSPSSKRARKRGQTIEAGEARGEFTVIVKDGAYILIFQPKVEHYKTNEFFKSPIKNLKHPTPWLSLVYGNLKMRIFVTTVVAKKMPNFVYKTTKISVGRSRSI